MKFFVQILTVVFALVLTACGGGGGNSGQSALSGSNSSNTSTIATTPTVTVVTAADIILGFDKTSLVNSGSDKVQLTATAVDKNRNVLSGVTVTVTVDSDAIFTGPAGTLTGTDGTFQGLITSPANKTNRAITVVVRSGSIVKTSTLQVVGSQIAVTSVPGAPSASQAVTFNLNLRDTNGTGIPATNLSLGGSFGIAGTVRTNSVGDAVVTTTAPAFGGTYTLVVSGSGVTTTQTVTVLGPSAGPTVAVDPPSTITAASINANPTNIRPNLASTQINKSQITFRMIDPILNLGVKNVRVKFGIVAPGLGAGESLSTGDAIVYTDQAGTVRTDYIAGVRTSPTNGVRIRACYAKTEAELAGTGCPNSQVATLTVGGEALNLSIFENNKLEGLLNNLIYKKTIAIQVADSAGNPVSGATISASVDITHYGKSPTFFASYPRAAVSGTSTFVGFSITLPPSITDTYTSNTLGNTEIDTPSIFRVWCVNEDLNRNGVMDEGEDLNRNRSLDPRASEVVILPVGTGVTDSTGVAQFQIQWGQNVATWLAYTVKVTTNVAGSEATNSKAFITDGLQADAANGSFLQPPYGGNPCNTAN